jgi:hypothetical protein
MDNITKHFMDKYPPPTYIKDSYGVLIVKNSPIIKEKTYLNSAIPKLKIVQAYVIAIKISKNKYYLCKNTFGKSKTMVYKKEMLFLIEKCKKEYVSLLENRINAMQFCLTEHKRNHQEIEQGLCERIKDLEEKLKLCSQIDSDF